MLARMKKTQDIVTNSKSDDEIYESPAIMTVPMIILSVLSVVGGFIGSFALFGDDSFTSICNVFESCFYQSSLDERADNDSCRVFTD